MISGGLGSFVGTPAEVALVRMTLDGRLPVAERRNYAHVFDALIRIAREEGVPKLWRGAIPTATRAMIVNAAQMPTYSQAKQVLISNGLMQQGFALHAVSSLFAGLVTTAVSLPVDIVKTRYQNMKVIDGKPEYSGILVSNNPPRDRCPSLARSSSDYITIRGVNVTSTTIFFLSQANEIGSKACTYIIYIIIKTF